MRAVGAPVVGCCSLELRPLGRTSLKRETGFRSAWDGAPRTIFCLGRGFVLARQRPVFRGRMRL